MIRKSILFTVIALVGVSLVPIPAHAHWVRFTYDTLPGDTIVAAMILDSTAYDSVNFYCGAIMGIELGFSWNTNEIVLDTLLIDSTTIFWHWGGLMYNVDSVQGITLLAGAGFTPISSPGVVFEAKFTYADSGIHWDSTKAWCQITKEYYNEKCAYGVGETEELLPSAFSLKQNYPNPFNPTTTIEFSLARAGEVTLSIYNLLGQRVTRVSFGQLAAGEYAYTWDGKNDNRQPVTSGIYLYRLETPFGIQAKKMTLLK